MTYKGILKIIFRIHRPPPQLEYIVVGTDLIQTSKSVKNIGVWFDNTLSMNKQVTMICKTGFTLETLLLLERFYLTNIVIILMLAFVTSRLDFCNSILSGLPQYLIEKLQYVQNSSQGIALASCE